MFEFIKGTVEEIYENEIVLERNGIGYSIKVSQVLINQVTKGEIKKVYTYLYIREDIIALYGFESKEALEMFKLLITVNGIGPKAAISILSILSVSDLRFAILSEDSKTIAKAQGVGAKTAGKLCLELKDKIKLEDAFENKLSETNTLKEASNAVSDATLALVALGYSNAQALKAIAKIDDVNSLSTKQIIKLALKDIK